MNDGVKCHPDPLINAEIRIACLEAMLSNARDGLKCGLELDLCTPKGLSIKADIRRALAMSDPTDPENMKP